MKSDDTLYSAMYAYQICSFLRFFLSACQSTCKFAWHQSVILPPLVLRRMGGQIHRFSPSASLSHKWLVICRNYCVEFSLFISAPFTRARIPGIFHFLLSQPSPKGNEKTLEFSWKMSNVFLFFSDVFRKTSDVFVSFFPRLLKVGFSLQTNVAEKSCFFLFLCRKNASFQHSCVKVVKAKKCKSQGRARVSRAREKDHFFSSKI